MIYALRDQKAKATALQKNDILVFNLEEQSISVLRDSTKEVLLWDRQGRLANSYQLPSLRSSTDCEQCAVMIGILVGLHPVRMKGDELPFAVRFQFE